MRKKLGLRQRARKVARRGVFGIDEDADGGVGGAAGMKKEGRVAQVLMMAVYRTRLGTWEGAVAQIGPMSWPSWELVHQRLPRDLQIYDGCILKGSTYGAA